MQLRNFFLSYSPDAEERWSYGMPFYYFGKKRVDYLWFHRQKQVPYVGFVDGKLLDEPDLLAESRSRMKIFFVNPSRKLPAARLEELLNKVMTATKNK